MRFSAGAKEEAWGGIPDGGGGGLCPGSCESLPEREASVKGRDPGSPPGHRVACGPRTPPLSQPLAPGFPDLLIGPQIIRPKCYHSGPSAALPRKQSVSGVLCWAVRTRSGLGKM